MVFQGRRCFVEFIKGDIISVNKKEWQHSKSKPYRPALTVIDGGKDYTFVAPITHINKHNKYHIILHSPEDLEEGELYYKTSYIKIDDTQPIRNKSIRKKIGKIKPEKINEVLKMLNKIITYRLLK